MDLIPCEYCYQYIEFSEYNNHINQCNVLNLFRLPTVSLHTNILPQNIPNVETNLDNDENEVEEHTETNLDNDENEVEEDFENEIDYDTDDSMPELETDDSMPELETDDSMPELEVGSYPFQSIGSNVTNLPNVPTNIIPSIIPQRPDIPLVSLDEQVPRLRYFHNLLRMLEDRSNVTSINNVFNTDTYERNTDLEDRIGKVTVGVKDIDLICKDMKLEKDDECLICREDFKKNDVLKQLDCTHYFCNSCIKEWFKNNTKCPVCQKDYDNKDNIIINY